MVTPAPRVNLARRRRAQGRARHGLAPAVAAAPPAKPAVPSSPLKLNGIGDFLGFAGSPLGAGFSGRVAGGGAGHGGVGAPRTPSPAATDKAIAGAEAAGANAGADDDAMSDKIDAEVQAELQKGEEEEEESDGGGTQAVREGSELDTAIEKHYGTFGAGTHHFEILDHKHMTQIGRGLYGVPCTLCRRIPADLNKKNATTVFRVLKSAHPGARDGAGYDSRKREREEEQWSEFDEEVQIVCRYCHMKAPRSTKRSRNSN